MHSDLFIGKNIEGYTICNHIGDGCVGTVYKASKERFGDRAIKFIELDRLRPNWENEITKVVCLEQTDGVVRYHSHGNIEVEGVGYLYIVWDYINGKNLRKIIEERELTLQKLIDVIDTTLQIFHACKVQGIQHSDFHSGNILIQNPTSLSITPNRRKVFITDFGRGTYSQDPTCVESLDDYKGLARIIQDGLLSIDSHNLELADRKRYDVLKNKFPRLLTEINITEGTYVRNPRELREQLFQLFSKEDTVESSVRNISDFMVAEYLGDRYDDWNALFVPKFLATDELFDRNISVLTGLRGCGKTTIFRRVSHDLKKKLGAAGIDGEDGFVGLYLNARTISEAFPWLPKEKMGDARKQVICYFNLKWTLIVLDWLKDEVKQKDIDISWLISFMSTYFSGDNIQYTGSSTESIINSISDYCQKLLHECKLDDAYHCEKNWSLVEYDYLEKLCSVIQENCGFVTGKSFFFFLDDYSTPMINESTQRILNPIIFRRSALIFFKVSTESTESFIPSGLNNKTLEDNNDYNLIDLSAKSLVVDIKECQDIIDSIFEKRLNRCSLFANQNRTLKELLGDSKISNNERARIIRSSETNKYYGTDVFYNIWSSDIRELIRIFSDMLTLSTGGENEHNNLTQVGENNGESDLPIIPKEIQDKVLRKAGGDYLNSLCNVKNKCNSDNESESISDDAYGEHLLKIVTAIQQIFYYDLSTKESKNNNQCPPKQPRKIEISTGPLTGKLSGLTECYYKGLIRYGVLISDTRGKSIRGTVATRLQLRSLFIPYFNITFSKRDSVTLDFSDFQQLLDSPETFAKNYCSKTKKRRSDVNVPPLSNYLEVE